MYNASKFMAGFRHYFPEGERFILNTLEQETLSPGARISLEGIQNVLRSIVAESYTSQASNTNNVIFYMKSNFYVRSPEDSIEIPISPGNSLEIPISPENLLEIPISPENSMDIPISPEDSLESPISPENSMEILPISPPEEFRDSDASSSQVSEFILAFDSPTNNNNNSPVVDILEETTTTTATTNNSPVIELKQTITTTTESRSLNTKYFKTIKIKRKKSPEFISKKIKLTTDSPVIISDDDTPPLECEIVPIGTNLTEDLYNFSSSSSSSYTSISSSSDTPERELTEEDNGISDVIDLHVAPEEDTGISDVIDLHVAPEEAFSSSENNTPETEVNVAEVAQEKLPVKSRLGTRVAPQSDTIELQPSFNLKFHSEKIQQYYSERPILCKDCHSSLPLVTSGRLKCRHCSCKYKQTEFERHMSPNRDTPPQCHFCKITFKTECEMNIHIKSKHPKIVLCDTCITSRLAKQLVPVVSSSSISPKHSVDGSYKCQDCCMRFKTILDLTNHTNVSHAALNSSPLVPEVHLASLPDRVPSLLTPRVPRSPGQELDPNCDLQISKNDALREFEFLISKQNL